MEDETMKLYSMSIVVSCWEMDEQLFATFFGTMDY